MAQAAARADRAELAVTALRHLPAEQAAREQLAAQEALLLAVD
jgi:hypothetical protein